MWYFITGIIFCLFILIGNSKRKSKSLAKYLILTLILPPVGFGLWQAEKPLVGSEVRYGGKGWNVLKWMALVHTVLCFVWMLALTIFAGNMIAEEAESAGEMGIALGAGIGLAFLGGIWFFGLVAFLIIGLIVKKPITETAQQYQTA